jgi:hypothetical protein
LEDGRSEVDVVGGPNGADELAVDSRRGKAEVVEARVAFGSGEGTSGGSGGGDRHGRNRTGNKTARVGERFETGERVGSNQDYEKSLAERNGPKVKKMRKAKVEKREVSPR